MVKAKSMDLEVGFAGNMLVLLKGKVFLCCLRFVRGGLRVF
jgi:hypothetical protein